MVILRHRLPASQKSRRRSVSSIVARILLDCAFSSKPTRLPILDISCKNLIPRPWFLAKLAELRLHVVKSVGYGLKGVGDRRQTLALTIDQFGEELIALIVQLRLGQKRTRQYQC